MNDSWNQVYYVDQSCHDCVVQIRAYLPIEIDPEGWVGVQVLSNHSEKYYGMWRVRIKNAWKVLRNRYDWSGFDLWDEKEAHEFVSAMTKAVDAAFPQEEGH